MKSNLATLYFELEHDRFIVFDVIGNRSSALHVLRAALGRVPFEENQDLQWRDHLPIGLVHGLLAKTAYEFVSPFIDFQGVEILYTMRRDGRDTLIQGRSTESEETPIIKTHARFNAKEGLIDAELITPTRSLKIQQSSDDSNSKA